MRVWYQSTQLDTSKRAFIQDKPALSSRDSGRRFIVLSKIKFTVV
jgi:hypothetical protein